MVELILLIIALLCLFDSATTSAVILAVAVGVVAYKRVQQQNEFERVKLELTDQAESLRTDLRLTRDMVDKISSQVAELKLTRAAAASTTSESAQQSSIHVPAAAPDPRPSSIQAPARPTETIRIEVAPSQPIQPRPATIEPKPEPKLVPAVPTIPLPVAPVLTPVAAQNVITPVAPPKVVTPVATTSAPVTQVEPPRRSATVSAPPPPALRSASFTPKPPAPTLQQRFRKTLDLEETLSTNWLNKIGIIILVLGVALFGIYELGSLGPLGKVLLLFTVGAALLGTGLYLDRNDRYRIIGRTAIGGGWALLFFTSYGMHHVAAMRVLTSQTADLLVMLGVAVGMALHTLRYRSQVVTGLAFLLAYSTVALTHDSVYALSAGAVLAIGLVLITVRLKWYELEVFGILSSFLNHFYWLYRLLGPEGSQHKMFPEFYPSVAILILYWFVFRVSYVVRRPDTRAQENVSTVAALLNTLLLLTVMKFQSVHPEMAFFALLGLGALEFAFGQLPSVRRRRPAFVLLSVLGAALMIMSVPFRFSGENVAVLWLLGAEVFFAAGILLKEVVFRRTGMYAALIVAVHLAIVDIPHLLLARATAEVPLVHAGVLLLASGVLYYLNAHFARFRWPELFTDSTDLGVLSFHSYLGAITFGLGIWAVAPHDWTAVAWCGMLLLLAFASGRLKSIDLFAQGVILSLLIVARAVMVNLDLSNIAPPHSMHRYLLVPLIACALYLASPLISFDSRRQTWTRALLTSLATALLATLVWTEVPRAWVPVAWMALGVTLALVAAWRKLSYLAYQEHALGLLAIGAIVQFNLPLCLEPGPLVIRIVPIALVAAALYGISRKASTDAGEVGSYVAYTHTWAATGLLAALGWAQLHGSILAVAWVAFALALAIAARTFTLKEFPLQAHVLALMAAARTVGVNLGTVAKYHGYSQRLLSTVAVIGGLYALSKLVPMEKSHRERDLHHGYTWVASALAGALMWYELQPLSVAVGWAILGLLLFEIGPLRNVRQLRVQGYVALFAAFVRIFFVNLSAAGLPGDLLSPRITTVVPIALILFFVYSQIAFRERTETPGRFDVTTLLAYAGSATVAALLYFQVNPGWIATSWAVLAALLLVSSLLLKQEVFLQQAVLLCVGIFVRGAIHNLFGGSYFTDAGWTGRFAELGSAVLILLASLPLAFRARKLFPSTKETGKIARTLSFLARRPEQVMFFVPILLLTLMLALKMRFGMVTVAWGIEGVLVVILALTVNERSFRLTGLGLLLLCVGKIMVIDAWRLAPRDRYITFIILGLALLGVSFLFTRYRETIRQYL